MYCPWEDQKHDLIDDDQLENKGPMTRVAVKWRHFKESKMKEGTG